ncbi:hypothetical protein HPB50_004019 [Hyalomma asiaticum]|uniref:Uncharacterized protein n=1 Tax=Hyalomma asiaticum TaxID=266040 RepID=A0ACB7SVB1_HYAAI|nr:hypothetical protein HPB50_004019 [Hyalomma asiaticum]
MSPTDAVTRWRSLSEEAAAAYDRDSRMSVEVIGEDISADAITEEAGWKTAGARRSRPRHREADSANDIDTRTNALGTGQQGAKSRNVKGKVIKAGRMPKLPKEKIKIVVRPQGGLDNVKVGAPTVTAAILAAAGITAEESAKDTVCPNSHQNIVVVSTPKHAHAGRYAKIRKIFIQDKGHEVNVYETAPDNTTKGVIRGISIEHGPDMPDEKIVNPRNPLALAAKRIGNTTTVVIAFDGLKVPKFVRYGATLIPCMLYRKQIDICYQCGRLGHRMDICPNPANRIFRGCGLRNSDHGHQCSPQCNLCGGAHMTADKACKALDKTPYVLRRRRWERQQANNQTTQQDYPPCQPTRPRSRSRSRGRSQSHSRRTRSRGPTRSRSRTPAAGDKVSWADTIRGTAREGVGKAPKVPEQNQTADNGIIEPLRKENSAMRELLQKLMHEVHELRRQCAAAEQPEQPKAQASVPCADAPAPEKRALQERTCEGSSESQVGAGIKNVTKMLSTLQSAIETLHATVLGLAIRTANLEENMQLAMNHPVFTMHGRVPASSNAGPSKH